MTGQAKTDFGSRLTEIMERKNITNKQLANQLEVTEQAVSNWKNNRHMPVPDTFSKLCRILNVTPNYLFGITDHVDDCPCKIYDKYDKYGVKWLAYIPDYIEGRNRRQFELAIENVRLTIEENMSPYDRYKILGWSEPEAVSGTIQALRGGAIRLLEVKTNNKLEQDFMERFKSKDLIEAIVVEPTFISGLLQAEMVAFLAARRILDNLTFNSKIGVGAGYTLLRTAELAQTNHNDGQQMWVPLTEFNEPATTDNIGPIAVSAQHIAEILVSRFSGSRSYRIRDETPMLDQLIMTVNGYGRGFDADGIIDAYQFRTVNQIASEYIRRTRDALGDKAEMIFGGEILGWIVSREGKLLDNITEAPFYSHFNLDELRSYSKTRRTWIIASRKYKALTTLIAVTTGIANSIIVDTETAKEMLSLYNSYD